MIYQVMLDGKTLYYPGDSQLCILEPKLELETGYAGEFECSIPHTNPLYETIKTRRSMISVLRDRKEIFYGEIRSCQKNMWKELKIYSSGALSFLGDTVQQADYTLPADQILEKLLEKHNRQTEERKWIKAGIVTASQETVELHEDYKETLDIIRENLVEKLGGYLRLRHEPDGLYLDWLKIEDYGKLCSQKIEFGENMLEYSEGWDATELITAIIPRGARIEEEGQTIEKRVDITSVNEGKDFVCSKEAAERFGYVYGVEVWDGITSPQELMDRAETYLKATQFEEMSLELTAADLSMLESSYEAFECGDRVHCRAKPYDMDRVIPIMSMSIPLDTPEKAILILGEKPKARGLTDAVTAKVSKINRQIAEVEKDTKGYTDRNIEKANAQATEYTNQKIKEEEKRATEKEDSLEVQLTETSKTLSSKVEDAKGELRSEIKQTADSITLTVENVKNGLKSEIKQTADSITLTVENKEKALKSEIKQTADKITSVVSDLSDTNEKVSKIEQTADKINFIVKSGTSESNFKMTDGAIELISKELNIKGCVTFSDLEGSGKTVINGSNITTGVIDATKVTVKNLNASNITAGSIDVSRVTAGGYSVIGLSSTNAVFGISGQNVVIGTNGKGIGFFGHGPASRQTVVSPTSDYMTMTSLNQLITALRNYGLIN